MTGAGNVCFLKPRASTAERRLVPFRIDRSAKPVQAGAMRLSPDGGGKPEFRGAPGDPTSRGTDGDAVSLGTVGDAVSRGEGTATGGDEGAGAAVAGVATPGLEGSPVIWLDGAGAAGAVLL